MPPLTRLGSRLVAADQLVLGRTRGMLNLALQLVQLGGKRHDLRVQSILSFDDHGVARYGLGGLRYLCGFHHMSGEARESTVMHLPVRVKYREPT